MSKEYFLSNVEVVFNNNDVADCLVSSGLFNEKAFSKALQAIVLNDSVSDLLIDSIEFYMKQDYFVERYNYSEDDDSILLEDFFFSLPPAYTKSGKTEFVEIKKGVTYSCLTEL